MKRGGGGGAEDAEKRKNPHGLCPPIETPEMGLEMKEK
jgi:hypothetical protein